MVSPPRPPTPITSTGRATSDPALDQLEATRDLPDADLLALITMDDPQADAYLAKKAEAVRERIYGNRVFIRGLIEFTNFCHNDCHY